MDDPRLVLPVDEDEIDGDASGDDADANAFKYQESVKQYYGNNVASRLRIDSSSLRFSFIRRSSL